MAHLPISALIHNIAPEIERTAGINEIDMQRAVEARIVHPEIDLICDEVPPRGPYADHTSKKVVLYESHLAFIWAYIYSNFTIFEKCIQEPMLERAFEWEVKFDRPLTQRAKALKDWSFRFSKEYISWGEKSLPNPKVFLDEEERTMCEKVNRVYLTAVNFLFFHEYAHLALKHHPRKDDVSWTLSQETEADNFAMSCITPAFSTENERHIAGLSIVLLCASNLFLPGDVRGIWQSTHPHLHDRLRNALTGLNLTSEKSKYYLYHLGSLCLRDWLEVNGFPTARGTQETSEDLFYEYLETIDRLLEAGA